MSEVKIGEMSLEARATDREVLLQRACDSTCGRIDRNMHSLMLSLSHIADALDIIAGETIERRIRYSRDVTHGGTFEKCAGCGEEKEVGEICQSGACET